MPFLTRDALARRRDIASGGLAPLVESLRADLDVVRSHPLYVPEHKALLSRDGGRCARDGVLLEFDPWSPHRHRCPTCGKVYSGEHHDRWWIYPYQLWLSERAVHAAVLGAVSDNAVARDYACTILDAYSAAYLHYPNRDNVLGPGRVFFSTYLESIWLLQLCIAAHTVDIASHARGHSPGGKPPHADTPGGFSSATGVPLVLERFRDQVLEPSLALIARFDEGHSNRQIWNNAARMAAAGLLGDTASAERIAYAHSGVESHLRHGLLADATWYEGENYHLFAHRGLWYCVELCAHAGLALDPQLLERFNAAFLTPFATALPDLTFPARKDSQHGVSLRQWRTAESLELGFARTVDTRLAEALTRLYAHDLPRGHTGRDRSSGEAERNVPAVALTRADLGWKSLLHAAEHLPATEAYAPRSVHLEHQGFTVFRRDAGRVYVSLDWGQTGGGHGHPDRLNMMLAHDDVRWLDDLGTGSYVDPSLHWFRSTLAHNAPLTNGHSQSRVPGRVVAFDERGGVGWILAEVRDLEPGVTVQRALVVTPDYVVDELRWQADQVVRIELPFHCDGESDAVWHPATFSGASGTEDGFDFVAGAEGAAMSAGHCLNLTASRGQHSVRAWLATDRDAEWFRCVAPGQPPSTSRRLHIVRVHGQSGAIRAVWAWAPRVTAVSFDGDRVRVELTPERNHSHGQAPSETHVHWQTPEYWQMEMQVGHAHSGIELFGWRDRDEPQGPPTDHHPPTGHVQPRATQSADPLIVSPTHPIRWTLGRSHYRPTDHTWEEAGCPTANVALEVENASASLSVEIVAPELVIPPSENPYDNESPDINGHGVQLYVMTTHGSGGWIITPPDGTARPVDGWGDLPSPHVAWSRTPSGFRLTLRFIEPTASSTHPIALDVIVNDAAPGRTRRRGQLVLTGAHGEFAFLRGDRHSPDALIPILVAAHP